MRLLLPSSWIVGAARTDILGAALAAAIRTVPAGTRIGSRTSATAGTNTAGTRYWGSGNYVWNNTGDKAYLRTSSGTSIDTCAWTSKGSGYTTC